MHFLSQFLNTIILLGSLQGFIICTLLYFNKINRQSNRLLAKLIFLIALAGLKVYMNTGNWYSIIPYAGIIDAFVPLIIIMPIGPLIFFYIQSYTDQSFTITKKRRVHFYPIIIDFVPQLIAVIYVIGLLSGIFKNNNAAWGGFIDTYNIYADIPRWLSITLYVGLSARYLKNKVPVVEDGRIKWLQQFVRIFQIFQVIWLLFLIPYVIPRYTNKLLDAVDWYPIYVPLAVLVYWLGIKGYIMSYRQAATEKKQNNTLQTDIVEKTVLALRKAMDGDKLYLNPELDLSILSQHTGIAHKIISTVLNQHMHKSFNEFINEYRINEVKERLLQPESKKLTIAGIAYECGFNSLPTFQRAFKTIIGLSPKEFILKNA